MFLIPVFCIVVFAVLLTGTSREKLDRIVDRNTEMLVSSVQELVRIPSVAGEPIPGAPFGRGPREALERALTIASRLGFSTMNLDNFAGYAEFGNATEYVGVLGHVDEVPEGENWSHPPFGGEIHDRKIYGRGALDDKGPALAALFGAKAVMESGLPLSRKVRVIFGADEETGDEDIAHYLSREKPPVAGFTPDADFPVVFAEKGILWLELEKSFTTPSSGTMVRKITGGSVPNMVPDTASAELMAVHPEMIVTNCHKFRQKTGFPLTAEQVNGGVLISAKGESAHASTPEKGKNAIMHLLKFLASQKLSPCEMTEAIRLFSRTIGCETTGKSFGVALSDAPSGNLTLNAGKIEAHDELFRITLDIRYPVTHDKTKVVNLVRATMKATGFSGKILKHQPPLHYPPESPLVQTLSNVYQDATGDQTPPVAIGGGTYARRLPNVVAFGPYRPGQDPPIHRQDECIAIDELVAVAKIYAHAIYELAK